MSEYAYNIRIKTGDIVTGLETHSVTFYLNTKTHQYRIVVDSKAEERELIMSKAKAEAVIKFLKFLTQ